MKKFIFKFWKMQIHMKTKKNNVSIIFVKTKNISKHFLKYTLGRFTLFKETLL